MTSDSTILLTKQTVAYRLLSAAVDAIDNHLEPLAAYLCAASALNVLSDLIRARGATYGNRLFAEAIFEAADSALHERQPVYNLPNDPQIEAAVEKVKSAIANGLVATASDIITDMPRSIERRAFDPIVRPFNFMKHADRDGDEMIDEAELLPLPVALQAIAAYAILFPEEPLPGVFREFVKRHVIREY